jgi:hypothetical protein
MTHSKKFWMAIKAIALDSFYRPYFYKDNNGNTIKQTEFKGIQIQINSPKQDMFTSLPCEPLTSEVTNETH